MAEETKGLNKNATRMLTGLIMGTIVLSCILYGKVAMLVMILTIIFLATKEYVKILEHKGFYPSIKVMMLSFCFVDVSPILQMLRLPFWVLYIAAGSHYI